MAILVKCKRGSADKAAPSISDTMIISNTMAVARGKRVIDDNYFLIKKYSLQVPVKSLDIVPSEWVRFSVSKLNLNNVLAKVKSYSISGSKSGLLANIEVEIYEEF